MFSTARFSTFLCGKSSGIYNFRSFNNQIKKRPSRLSTLLKKDRPRPGKIENEEPILQKKFTEVGKAGKDYVPPFINRPKSELWKPLVFTFGFSGCCYVGASIWHYERHRSLKDYLYNSKRWGYQKKEKLGELRQELNVYWNKLSVGDKTVATLIGLNTLVFLCWRYIPLRPFMYRYFTNSFHGTKLYSSMILSAFSHSNLIHLGLNMYVLWSFSSVAIDKLLGLEQFVGIYLSAAAFSSFTSYFFKTISGKQVRALGASGAILALIIYVCCKFPDGRLQIVFLPMFNFSAAQAVYGIIAFDLIGLLFRFRIFDHAAHLGGSFFGLWYATYGEKMLWGNREWIVKEWISITGRK